MTAELAASTRHKPMCALLSPYFFLLLFHLFFIFFYGVFFRVSVFPFYSCISPSTSTFHLHSDFYPYLRIQSFLLCFLHEPNHSFSVDYCLSSTHGPHHPEHPHLAMRTAERKACVALTERQTQRIMRKHDALI